jgi:hypothetical protein
MDERLVSIVRALTDVVFPSLPCDAGLAQEQIQLCIAHLQIIRKQLDATPSFEAEELADAVVLAAALIGLAKGGEQTRLATAELSDALRNGEVAGDPGAARSACKSIHDGISRLIRAIGMDGDDSCRHPLRVTILDWEKPRTLKDRRWCAAFGFDVVAAEL